MTHRTNKVLFIFTLLLTVVASNAQVPDLKKITEENDRKEREYFEILLKPQFDGDVRERYYYYEVLNPVHEKKNKVTGWAESRIDEPVNRGLVVVMNEKGEHYISWRLLKNDSSEVAFNLYRSENGKKAIRLNEEPLKQTTDYIDKKVKTGIRYNYWVKPVSDNKELES